MTTEDLKKLKPGDIVEFSSGSCYWLAKLVSVKTDPVSGEDYWVCKNRGRAGRDGLFGTSVLKHPEHINVVGFSQPYR